MDKPRTPDITSVGSRWGWQRRSWRRGKSLRWGGCRWHTALSSRATAHRCLPLAARPRSDTCRAPEGSGRANVRRAYTCGTRMADARRAGHVQQRRRAGAERVRPGGASHAGDHRSSLATIPHGTLLLQRPLLLHTAPPPCSLDIDVLSASCTALCMACLPLPFPRLHSLPTQRRARPSYSHCTGGPHLLPPPPPQPPQPPRRPPLPN